MSGIAERAKASMGEEEIVVTLWVQTSKEVEIFFLFKLLT